MYDEDSDDEFTEEQVEQIQSIIVSEQEMFSSFKELLSVTSKEFPKEILSRLNNNLSGLKYKFSRTKTYRVNIEVYSYLSLLFHFQLDKITEKGNNGIFDCIVKCDEICKQFKELSFVTSDVFIDHVYPEIDTESHFYAISALFFCFYEIYDSFSILEKQLKKPQAPPKLTKSNLVKLKSVLNVLVASGFTTETMRIVKIFYAFAFQYSLNYHVMIFQKDMITIIKKNFDSNGNYISQELDFIFMVLDYFYSYANQNIDKQSFAQIGLLNKVIKMISNVKYSDPLLKQLIKYITNYPENINVIKTLEFSNCQSIIKQTKDIQVAMYFLDEMHSRINLLISENIKLNPLNKSKTNISLMIFAEMKILTGKIIESYNIELYNYFIEYNGRLYLKRDLTFTKFIKGLNLNSELIIYKKYLTEITNLFTITKQKIPFLGRAIVLKTLFHLQPEQELTFIHEKTNEEKTYSLTAIYVEKQKKKLFFNSANGYIQVENGVWQKIILEKGKTNVNYKPLNTTILEELNQYKNKESYNMLLFYKEKSSFSVYSLFDLNVYIKDVRQLTKCFMVKHLINIIKLNNTNIQIAKENIQVLAEVFYENKFESEVNKFIEFLNEYVPEYKNTFIDNLMKFKKNN